MHCGASVSESAMESVIRNQVQRRRRVIGRAQDQHQRSRKGSERPQVQHRRGGSETAQVQRIGKSCCTGFPLLSSLTCQSVYHIGEHLSAVAWTPSPR